MACDHAAFYSGRARYLRATRQLQLMLICDGCGAERVQLGKIDYVLEGRRFVGHLAELTARELGLSEARVARVRFAALVCGAARNQIRPELLNKRGPLTEEEWAEVRRQPELAAALLTDVSFDDIREWVLCQRERVDGSGYPRGLVDGQIPLEARILAVTEAYVAMTSDRPHRVKCDHREACLELCRCAGTQFDASTVQAFLRASVRRNPQLARAAA